MKWFIYFVFISIKKLCFLTSFQWIYNSIFRSISNKYNSKKGDELKRNKMATNVFSEVMRDVIKRKIGRYIEKEKDINLKYINKK